MLVLSRKAGESLYIGGGITISVASTSGGRVKLAIDAPAEIPIKRGELLEREASARLPIRAVQSHPPLMHSAHS